MVRSIETHREKVIDFLTSNGIENEHIVDVIYKLSKEGARTDIEFGCTLRHEKDEVDVKGYYVFETDEDTDSLIVFANDYSNGGWHCLEQICSVKKESEALEKIIGLWHEELRLSKEKLYKTQR